jgi:hypothetical protein
MSDARGVSPPLSSPEQVVSHRSARSSVQRPQQRQLAGRDLGVSISGGEEIELAARAVVYSEQGMGADDVSRGRTADGSCRGGGAKAGQVGAEDHQFRTGTEASRCRARERAFDKQVTVADPEGTLVDAQVVGAGDEIGNCVAADRAVEHEYIASGATG